MEAAMAHGTYRQLAALPFHLAQIVRGALEAEGIDVLVERDALAQIYALHTGAHATRLYVPAEKLSAAQALIREIESEGR